MPGQLACGAEKNGHAGAAAKFIQSVIIIQTIGRVALENTGMIGVIVIEGMGMPLSVRGGFTAVGHVHAL